MKNEYVQIIDSEQSRQISHIISEIVNCGYWVGALNGDIANKLIDMNFKFALINQIEVKVPNATPATLNIYFISNKEFKQI